MRWRFFTLLVVLGIAGFLGALYLRRSDREPGAREPATTAAAPATPALVPTRGEPGESVTVQSASTAPVVFPNTPPPAALEVSTNARQDRLKFRLTNTTRSAAELANSDTFISLENAVIDSSLPINLPIPESLRAKDPGSYIVQSRGPIDNAFRARLAQSGATIVSYIPRNAYLVRASAGVAQTLAALPGTQAVLPFEPYYKLKYSVLRSVMEQLPLPPDSDLNLIVFADAREATIEALQNLGATVVSDHPSSFGRQVTVRNARDVIAVAALPGVHIVELVPKRIVANDLSRVRIGIVTNSLVTSNYLGLTGSNVIVQVNDSGVDASHPDFANGRVFGAATNDTIGHGTHVAGIIAGNGSQSASVGDGAIGSVTPAVEGQFRGMAPLARIFSMPIDGAYSDFELQEMAAKTNALISNNSWNNASFEYDISSANFDAGVRDSLPGVTGSQPVIYVFSAGNAGNGNDNGLNGSAGSIVSPANAKNIITVGSIEQDRNVTNETKICETCSPQNPVPCSTNTPWLNGTDSQDEVASFSSRGNVGPGIEGEFGRFKPDVVAPGTFVISLRSGQWDTAAYYNPTNFHLNTRRNQTVDPGVIHRYSIFVPCNTVRFDIFTSFVSPSVDLPLYAREGSFVTTADFVANNFITIPTNNLPLFTDTTWFYGVGNPTNAPVRYNVSTLLVTTNDNGNYFEVLSNMNQKLGPPDNTQHFYRYESGTSQSAPVVSGFLALMEDYFISRLHITNASPALMKALLINGARSVNEVYDFEVRNDINLQGWGLVSITNSLPGTNTQGAVPMLFFDQSPTNALATGDKRTINIRLEPLALNQPIRITLVWTDPPGNPAAGVKLVNDLDLIVTNLDTVMDPTKDDLVYFGNDIASGANFNSAWDTNKPIRLDVVNNVENVYLSQPFGTNFSITVVGRSVNVNAVTAHTNNVVQDYALVISSGNNPVTNAFSIVDTPPGFVQANVPNLTIVTNSFPPPATGQPGLTGGLLLGQHVGANTPLIGISTVPLGTNTMWGTAGSNGVIHLGVTNQWHFYVLTNTEPGFTNAAFVTFLSPTLALPRMGVTNYDHPDEATRVEADIDLFVSTDPTLLNLNPVAIANADKAVGRGGTEVIALSNAVPGTYYVGVHSEDQEAAEYGFFGGFSDTPFSSVDGNGIQLLRGINVPQVIPDGTPNRPGVANVLALAIFPTSVRRVVVTNLTVTHEDFGDLIGVLSHNQKKVALHNHTFGNGNLNHIESLIYEDAGEGDIFGSRRTDGPGRLTDYIGDEGAGVWLLTEVDNALGHTGAVNNLLIRLDPQLNTNGASIMTIQPNSFAFNFIDVPAEATNLTIQISGNTLPLILYVKRGALPSQTDFEYTKLINPPGDQLSISRSDLPPLRPGRYHIGIFNPNSVAQTITLRMTLFLDLTGIPTVDFTSGGAEPILDDAVTHSSIFVTNNDRIVRTEVGVALVHPRVSDLALTLIAPNGKRVLLYENRGGPNTADLGGGTMTTNFFGTETAGGFTTKTNSIGPVATSGTLEIDYDFGATPDTIDVYYEGTRLNPPPSGPIFGAGTFTVTYGPGAATNLTIIMNQGSITNDPASDWQYSPRIVSLAATYFTFTENTNSVRLPLKFSLNNPNLGTNTIISDFEPPVVPGLYSVSNNPVVAGWTVLSNQVSVVNDSATAQAGSQYLALASGAISNNVPLVQGGKYSLSYSYRGPGIVGWWRGEPIPGMGVDEVNGYSGPPQNLINIGGAVDFAINATPGSPNPIPRLYIPDQPAFKLTNSLSIEAWIRPATPAFTILMRGDNRGGNDPYVLGMDGPIPFGGGGHLGFSIDNTVGNSTQIQTPAILPFNQWLHVAGTLNGSSGEMKLYVNGNIIAQTITAVRPGGDLLTGPGDEPGLGIANVSGTSINFPFSGDLDEISLYSRALSQAEIMAIYARTNAGKFERNLSVPVAQRLAKAQVSLGGITDTFYGDNVNWATRTINFTALGNTIPLTAIGLQPGILLDSFILTQFPADTFAMPEEGLRTLIGDRARGLWQLEIWDTRLGQPVTAASLLSWQLRFIFENEVPAPVPLPPFVPVTNTIPCGFKYFTVDVPPWARFATNTIISASAPVNVWFNQTTPPVGGGADTVLIGAAVPGSKATLGTNTVPPLIPGARYYLGVQNVDCSNAVTFVIQVDYDITALTNAIPYTNAMSASAIPRYFLFDVSTNATAVSFQLLNLTGNLDLVARKGGPLPTPADFDYGSFNPGTFDEDIIVFTNSTPVPLSPGRWFLGVFNSDLALINYTILATEYTNPIPPIITLTNGIAYTNSNSGATNVNADYYRYVVSPAAVRVQFEINNPSGDVTLVARKGLPLPDLFSYDYISANAFTNDELIVVLTNSTPVRLSPGNWFLTAINTSGGLVNYSIKATEFAVTGRPIIITSATITDTGTNSSFCITWNSVPGVSYHVEGVPDLLSTNWAVVSPTIVATGPSTSYCVPLPSPYHFFRVAEGLAVSTYLPPPAVTGIQTPGGFLLRWNGPITARYQVQWTAGFAPPNWITLPPIITSPTGQFSFLDDGSQTGGLGAQRYYRILLLP